LTALDEPAFRGHFGPQDVQSLWGVGPRLAVRMRSLGIMTVGDLARAPIHVLEVAFGIIGPQMREAAQGHDDTPLVPYHRGVDAKSMGHEVTLPADSGEPAFLEGTLLRLSDQVARRMRGEGYVGRTVALKLRTRRFETFLRQRALDGHTDDHRALYACARDLLHALWRGGPLRLLGVSVSGLVKRSPARQAELFEGDARARRLVETLDRVRDRHGEASVVPLGSLRHRRGRSHVPFGALSGRAIAPPG
jgi:DNA polymerase-4